MILIFKIYVDIPNFKPYESSIDDIAKNLGKGPYPEEWIE